VRDIVRHGTTSTAMWARRPHRSAWARVVAWRQLSVGLLAVALDGVLSMPAMTDRGVHSREFLVSGHTAAIQTWTTVVPRSRTFILLVPTAFPATRPLGAGNPTLGCASLAMCHVLAWRW